MSLDTSNIMRQLTADKKKLSVMLGLLAVGLLLWGRLLLKDVPKTATASPPVAASAPASGGASPARAGADQPEDTRYAMTVVMDIPSELPRDVFAMNTAGYRRVKTVATQKYEPKAPPQTTDMAFRRAQVREAALDLRLEGVIVGEQPAVIINGQLFQQGQTVEGFVIEKIGDRNVVLEMDGVLIRLSM